jgi:hypothetical protein
MQTVFRLLLILIIGSLISCKEKTADIYVSPHGSDNNKGLKDQPVQSLVNAQKQAKKYAGRSSVHIILEDGTYYLTETFMFKPGLRTISGSPTNAIPFALP